MGTSQITSLTIVYSIVYSDADQRKHQSSASLAFVRGIGEFPEQMASYAEKVSIWWRHHDIIIYRLPVAWLSATILVSFSKSGDHCQFLHFECISRRILKQIFACSYIDAGAKRSSFCKRHLQMHVLTLFKELYYILIYISEVSSYGPCNTMPASALVMAWHCTSDKALPETMMIMFTDASVRLQALMI